MASHSSRFFPKKLTFHLSYLVLFLLVLATRFWRLSQLFHWTLDEEFWSYIPHNIAALNHIPLIGGHISGTGLYSGPFFVWLLSPLFVLINSHPLGIAFLVSSLGTVTTIFIYWLFSRLKSPFLPRYTASLAALFYAFSTLAVIYDRKYWNATPIPFLSLITLYLIHRLIKKPSTPLTLFLALSLTVAFHAHMTGAVLIVFTLLAWYLYRLPKHLFFKLALALLILQTPLYLFELRHNFTNTRALINLISPQSSSSTPPTLALSQSSNLVSTTFSRLIYTPAVDIDQELTLCSDYAQSRSRPSPAIFLLAGLVLISSLNSLRQKNPFALLLWTNIALLFIYRQLAPAGSWYPGQLSEYFLLPSFIAFFFLAAASTIHLNNKYPLFAQSLIIFLIIINLHTTLNLTHSHGFARKDSLVKHAINSLNGQPFTLNVSGPPCQIYGYRYLFSIYHYEPVSSYLDSTFLWLYQTSLDTRPAQVDLTIYPQTDRISIKPHEAIN